MHFFLRGALNAPRPPTADRVNLKGHLFKDLLTLSYEAFWGIAKGVQAEGDSKKNLHKLFYYIEIKF